MVIAVFLMRLIYAPIKLLSAKDKVAIISRQSDEPSLDIKMLRDSLASSGTEVQVLARTLGKGLGSHISYIFEILRQMKAISTSKVVVLDSYCIAASVLRHKDGTKIIQMWHAAAAVKKFGYQTIGKPSGTDPATARIMRMHRGYDAIAVSGEKQIPVFSECFDAPKEKFRVTGLPRLDHMTKGEDEKTAEIVRKYGLGRDGRKTVLYVPTFRKGKASHRKELAASIDSAKYDLLIHLHPLEEMPAEGEDTSGARFAEGDEIYDLVRAADIIVGDYSSLMIECSAIAKPVYVYAYDIEEYKEDPGLNIDYMNESIGKYVYGNAEDLAAALDEPYDRGALAELGKKYISAEPGACTDALSDLVKEMTAR